MSEYTTDISTGFHTRITPYLSPAVQVLFQTGNTLGLVSQTRIEKKPTFQPLSSSKPRGFRHDPGGGLRCHNLVIFDSQRASKDNVLTSSTHSVNHSFPTPQCLFYTHTQTTTLFHDFSKKTAPPRAPQPTLFPQLSHRACHKNFGNVCSGLFVQATCVCNTRCTSRTHRLP